MVRAMKYYYLFIVAAAFGFSKNPDLQVKKKNLRLYATEISPYALLARLPSFSRFQYFP